MSVGLKGSALMRSQEFVGNVNKHFRCKESIRKIADKSIPLERFRLTSKLPLCQETQFPLESCLTTVPLGSSIPIGKLSYRQELRKIPSHRDALSPLESSLTTWKLFSHHQAPCLLILGTLIPTGKLPCYQEAPYALKSFLVTGSSLPSEQLPSY